MTPSNLHDLLPHRGDALWLHSIAQHDADRISGYCRADCLQHLHAAHSGWLFEAAAQLCAAHGALYANDYTVTSAHLGKVSAVRVHAAPVPHHGLLQLQAQRLGNSTASALYQFSVSQQQRPLLDGQLLVVLGHA